jgi:hypothetical protein
LAYNKTDGTKDDLIQSLLQADIQWSSQIMGWVNNLWTAPAWYNDLYQKVTQAITKIVAPELDEHVLPYHAELVQGHGVLVVSHSQGNFYVNEAKPLLKQISTNDRMDAFGIFGVAVPANNVGGARSPYYTNHRDFIQHILPDTLPENWKLRHVADGALADDVGPIAAHFFNDTYMSNKFDMKPALLNGFKTSLANLRLPQPQACANYRKLVSDQVEGVFAGQYAGYGDVVSISMKDSVANLPDGAISFTSPSDGAFLSHSLEGSNVLSTGRGITFTGENGGRGQDYQLKGYWESSGQFSMMQTPAAWWQRTDRVPNSSLVHSIDLVSVATNEMRNYRGVFPPGACKTYADVKNNPLAYTVNARYLPIAVNGADITVGEQTYSLGLNLQSESMGVPPVSNLPSPNPVDLESQFTFNTVFTDGTSMMLKYKQFKGMVLFTFTSTPKVFICSADWYN